jgi:hypothetical protein
MRTRTLWIALIVLAVLTPLGLWLPERLRAGGAWGEWGPEEVGKQVGHVPEGMARTAERWQAPAPDYAPRGWEDRPLSRLSIAYIASAFIGIAVCAALAWALGLWLSHKEGRRAT